MNNDSLELPNLDGTMLSVTANVLATVSLIALGIALCFVGIYVAQLRRDPDFRTLSGPLVLAWVAMPVLGALGYGVFALGTGQPLLPEVPAGVGPLLGAMGLLLLGVALLIAVVVAAVWAVRTRVRLRARAAEARQTYAEAMRLYLDFETVQAYDRPELVTTDNPKVKHYLAKMGPAQEAFDRLEGSRIITTRRVENAQAAADALLRALKQAAAGGELEKTPSYPRQPGGNIFTRTLSGIRGMINS